MKMLNSFKIDKKVQKVVETQNGYIMNGHYYDKETMSPKALEFYPTYGDVEDIALNKRLSVHTVPAITTLTTGDAIIVDKTDPTISYIFTCNHRTSNLISLKLREVNGECKVLATVQYGPVPGPNPNFIECIGQDAQFIYCSIEWNTSGGACHFVKIDKFTLLQTTINAGISYQGSMRGIYEDENLIFYGQQRLYGGMYIWRYKKNTGVNEAVTIPAANGSVYFNPVMSKPIVKSPTEVIFYALHQQITPSKFIIIRYKINPSEVNLATLATASACDITWKDILEIPMPATITSTSRFELSITDTGTKKYLNVISYESGNSVGVNNHLANGIFTFLIDDVTKNLVYKSKVTGFPLHFRGAIGLTDNMFLVGLTTDSTYFYAFNKVEEKFTLSQQMNNQPLSIGIDKSDRIWIENGLTEVDMVSITTPTQVNVKFEKPSYSYEGTDIDSFVTIEAVNYNGVKIETTLELTLKGNAIFTSTGNKVTTQITGTSGPKQVPIKVTGAGSVSVYIKVVI